MMSALRDIDFIVKRASGMVFSSESDANRIDYEASTSGKPAMRAPTRKEWSSWISSSRPKATISAANKSQSGALMQGGNANPDEMLGRRMNPILIAPAMASAQSFPTSAMSALKEGLGNTLGSDLRMSFAQFAKDRLASGGVFTAGSTMKM